MPTLHAVFSRLAIVLVPLSVTLTAYLYLYPFAHQCAFPAPPPESQRWLDECAFEDDALREYYKRKDLAPFRLLALGDPQLEGDTSLPSSVQKTFPGFEQLWQELSEKRWEDGSRTALAGAKDLRSEAWRFLLYVRKYLDLLGNDFYLAHIYRTLHWTMRPTHVTVLGDLLGSQWVNDEEFANRSGRFWKRVFHGAEVTPQDLFQRYANKEGEGPRVQVLGAEGGWEKRIISVVGNHDIGYAGDIVRSRIDRFERAFGPVNGDLQFTLPLPHCQANSTDGDIPALRLVVLNSMNIDAPAFDEDLQHETFDFVNSIIHHSHDVGKHTTSTILLTHIPLHKEAGICVDAPYFSYFPPHQAGGIQEQNMISKEASVGAILQGIFGKSPDTQNSAAHGLGRDGIILTGHDHEGCDVYHYVDRDQEQWTAARYTSDTAVKAREDASLPGLREVTVRSMMGEFGGYAALVSAWWDMQQGKWQIEVAMCSLGVQHIWWAVHIIDLAAIVMTLLALLTPGSAAQPRPIVVEKKHHSAVVAGARRAKSPGKKEEHGGKTDELHQSTPKRRSSAFSRRMRQSLAEEQVEVDSDSPAARRQSPGAKQKKRKPVVKLKHDT